MKKSILAAVIALLVFLSTLFWFLNIRENFNIIESLQVGVIFLLVAFGLYFAWRRMKSAGRGEPDEDEYSKKVMQKSAALSYFISLYLWVVVIYIKDRVDWDAEVLIGSGILAMGVVFALAWLFFNYRGIRE